jgi:uncharacterized protein YicC (UPF0701 family)
MKAPRASKASKADPMSAEHKEALQQGREEGRIVKDYLEALVAHRPKRGRKVTTETLTTRLNAIDEKFDTARPIEKLALAQERININEKLASTEQSFDMEELERNFVKVAKSYAERKGFGYDAFRALDVPVKLLKEAGVAR